MKTAIKVENLCKRYRLGAGGFDEYGSLRESIMAGLSLPWQKPGRLLSNDQNCSLHHDHHKHIWPCKDISFEIREGQAVAVIGSNGAGKSTLLKILTRITEPTSGRAVLRGRVSSLLEVGTGFHSELTG